MVEQFENNYVTQLNGAIDSDDTTIVVDAGPIDMTGSFRIKIDDELIMVGSVSGTTFSSCTRGIEGTVAASHSDNAVVEHVLTAEGLQQGILDQIVSSGPIDYDIQYYGGGDISLTSTTLAVVSGPADLVINATAGDIVMLGLGAMPVTTTAQSMAFDYATIVGGSPVNYLATRSGTPENVPPLWYIGSGEVIATNGQYPYVVQANDVSSGTVTFRLYYRVSGTRTVNASSDQPLILTAVNIGNVNGVRSTVIRLDYLYAGADQSAVSLGSATWTDMVPNQNFEVASTSSALEMNLRLNVQARTTTGDRDLKTRLLIDGTTPLDIGGWHYDNTSYYGLVGGSAYITGLSVGTHTVKAQAYSGGAGGDFYLRPSATSGVEYLRIQIIEH